MNFYWFIDTLLTSGDSGIRPLGHNEKVTCIQCLTKNVTPPSHFIGDNLHLITGYR